jgi:hypothetical protein
MTKRAREDDCIICLKSVHDAPCRQLDCGHDHFHEECVNVWLEITPACPTCKRPVAAAVEAHAEREEARRRAQAKQGKRQWKRRHLGLPENEWVSMHLAFEASLVEQ